MEMDQDKDELKKDEKMEDEQSKWTSNWQEVMAAEKSQEHYQ